MGRREQKSNVKSALAKRLKELFSARSMNDIAELLGNVVSEKTIWKYKEGEIIPPPDILLVISRAFGISLDWLLKGQESLIPKDGAEEDIIIKYRRAMEAGVADQAQSFLAYLVQRADAQSEVRRIRNEIAHGQHLDNFGKRLRYIRESERGESIEEMAEDIGLTPRDYLKLEEGAEQPGTRVLTALSGLLRDPDSRSDETLDWVLTGKV